MKDPINNLKNNFVRLRFNRTINVIFTNLSIFRTTNRVGPLVSARHACIVLCFFIWAGYDFYLDGSLISMRSLK